MTDPQLFEMALEELCGPALVLDARHQLILRTAAAARLLGVELPLGVNVVQLLCGEAKARPIAEALAEGRAARARVVRGAIDAPGAAAQLWVRTVPLGEPVRGWVLLLEDTRAEDELGQGEANEAGQAGLVEFHGMLSQDLGMKALFADLVKVARADSSVLVRGETGSGKELVARALHLESRRKEMPFRAINCAALPPQLLESELFGHMRGTFTGAVRDYEGHFRMAHKGTLFLDEVAEMPLDLQAKLLRVLQERTVLPIGGREPIPVDVRIVAATHRSLRAEVAAGRFRADLMYRLRVIPLFLPALRERPGDIRVLAQHFVQAWNARSERHVDQISAGALRALEDYEFPGNIRELQNAIEYAFVMGSGNILTEAELPPEVRGEEGAEPAPMNIPPEITEGLPPEARRLLQALERAAGSRERAAQSLGISRTTLWRKLKRYGLVED